MVRRVSYPWSIIEHSVPEVPVMTLLSAKILHRYRLVAGILVDEPLTGGTNLATRAAMIERGEIQAVRIALSCHRFSDIEAKEC